MLFAKLVIFLSLYNVISAKYSCKLSKSLKTEIQSYKEVVERIKNAVVEKNAQFRNFTWNELASFVDKFGSRIAGSENLENSIDFLLDRLKNTYQLQNVHGEEAEVPHWVRGEESAYLIKPRPLKLSILGLGGSVGTEEQGITAGVIVVKSFAELRNTSDSVRGKIVVFNEKYVSYGETVQYRSNGASEAGKLGAAAVLIRSITPFSISSPHTGAQTYSDSVKIPTACISIEDAQLLQRFYDRGIPIQIKLKMGAKMLPNAISRNIVSEIIGSENPNEVVLVSGHIDSWDVGQGAMDDGGGAFISWTSLYILKELNLIPKRTIRSVLWTAEEEGYWGARSYLKNHLNEIQNITVVMESDEGTFTPTGLEFYGSEKAACTLKEILKLFEPLNATRLVRSDYPVGSDIALWQDKGVPGISLGNQNGRYFWYHHSEGDMMTVESPKDLDLCAAVWASAAYILADMNVALSRISHTSVPTS